MENTLINEMTVIQFHKHNRYTSKKKDTTVAKDLFIPIKWFNIRDTENIDNEYHIYDKEKMDQYDLIYNIEGR